jgi:hypothetical protein
MGRGADVRLCGHRKCESAGSLQGGDDVGTAESRARTWDARTGNAVRAAGMDQHKISLDLLTKGT